MKILITGAAGFIGQAISQRLLIDGHTIIGLDNLNDYYDPQLKLARLNILKKYPNFSFSKIDIADPEKLAAVFAGHAFEQVVHLAAQAGVRYSIDNPKAYIDANLVGFANILENCRQHKIQHLLFASSSSVYGANIDTPFSEHDRVDHPISLYAATKKANELLAHSYASLFQIACTGLRFFTVYGPWGRPDMAYFKFTKAILAGQPIDVYHQGELLRDFTYIDDIVEGIARLLPIKAQPNPNWDAKQPDPATSFAPYRIYNIGNNQPIKLLDFITTLEAVLDRKAKLNFLPMQPGDVLATHANTDLLNQAVQFMPNTSLRDGLSQFADWYRSYYS